MSPPDWQPRRTGGRVKPIFHAGFDFRLGNRFGPPDAKALEHAPRRMSGRENRPRHAGIGGGGGAEQIDHSSRDRGRRIEKFTGQGASRRSRSISSG